MGKSGMSLAERRFGQINSMAGSGTLAGSNGGSANQNQRMNAMKNKLNLGGQGQSNDRLENIRIKSLEIHQKFENNKENCFDFKYILGPELGQGMHA